VLSDVKKGRKFDLATALQIQRRYKSNKRNYRIPVFWQFASEIFTTFVSTLYTPPRVKSVRETCFTGDRELRGGALGFSETGRGHRLAASDPGFDLSGDDAVFAGGVDDAQITLA
jgi:hypothetical protein